MENPANLRAAVRDALRYDREVIVEEAIAGFEVGCAVMGNAELTTGRADEIEIQGDLFDYTEKYNLITSKIHMPARVDAETERRIRTPRKASTAPSVVVASPGWTCSWSLPGVWCSMRSTRYPVSRPTAVFPT